MPPLQDIVACIPEADRPVVFEFFVVFSRFEYALKCGGYLDQYRNEDAKPDWRKFEDDIKESFECIDDAEFKAAVERLLENPPMKQVVVNGNQLDWKRQKQRNDESRASYALRLVRTVRNNLFHGGKLPYQEERDRELVGSARTVLLWCVELRCKVRDKFYSLSDCGSDIKL